MGGGKQKESGEGRGKKNRVTGVVSKRVGLFEMSYTSLPPAGESSRLQLGWN